MCSKHTTLRFVLHNSVWKCHNASGRELPRQASSNDVQILSLLVADISDSMLHPVSFRFIPINTGVFIASNSSIVRVFTRATSRSPWTRRLTHLSHSSPSEHLEQIVVARNTSIYGVRNETEDTVWFLALLKTLFWLVPLLNYESCAIRTSHTSNTGPSFKSYHNVRGVFSMLHCCRATRLLMFVVLERISEHSYSNTFPNALALL